MTDVPPSAFPLGNPHRPSLEPAEKKNQLIHDVNFNLNKKIFLDKEEEKELKLIEENNSLSHFCTF
jgi:hypothetical protein